MVAAVVVLAGCSRDDEGAEGRKGAAAQATEAPPPPRAGGVKLPFKIATNKLAGRGRKMDAGLRDAATDH
ncbi:MAG: hypothetical protein KC776_35395 [Myxococcales bacterium]|nr:hypothetical protein [Myxococcales bacterium]MCB9578645.1 hypothetical protein [Polyangiaceae bacterium]